MSEVMLRSLKINGIVGVTEIAFIVMRLIFQYYDLVMLYNWAHVMLYILIIASACNLVMALIYDIFCDLRRRWILFRQRIDDRLRAKRI